MIDWKAEQSDKFIGTAAAIASLIAASVTTAGSVYAAHKTSETAEDSAKTQADAASHAADLQKQAADDTLNFTKQQSENDYRNQEVTRKANYDQYAAQRSRLGTLGSMLGLPAPDIPDYVPSQDPNFTGSGPTGPTTGQPSGSTNSTPSGDLTNPSTWMSLVGNNQALSSWVTQGLGSAASKPGLVDYYVGKIKGQPGANATEQAGSAAYWLNKLKSDPNVTGAPSGTLATPTPQPTGTLGSMVAPYQTASPTAALQAKPYDGTLIRFGA